MLLFLWIQYIYHQSSQCGSMTCTSDSQCPWLYFCNTAQKCEHDPIFPLHWYPILIYLLVPLGAGFVNVAGKSMGILKVLLFMNLLRYDTSHSTTLIQPMVAGSALPNILSVVFKRHPYLPTSLIDYDLILVVVPCGLLGSTLGSFMEKLIPELVKDLLIIVFFGFFSYRFYQKAKSFKQENPLQKSLAPNNTDNPQIPIQPADLNIQLATKKQEILTYEKSLHAPDIVLSISVFLVFQFLVFGVQGKLWFYHVKVCTWEYLAGLLALLVVTVGYLELIRKFLCRKYVVYSKLGIRRNMDMSQRRNFGLICLAGYCAGLVQGVLGVGSGTFIMGIFMALDLHPRVAAATSGYQILFVGLAAMTEQFITNSIKLEDALFLFLLTCIGGGMVTFILYKIFKKFSDAKVNRFVVVVMCVLSASSAVFMVPFLIQQIMDFGLQYLFRIPFKC